MMRNKGILANDPDWWRGAVIYQIYPRSYQDTNHDGIGDLKGITQRLAYIADLGVDAIWISPFFPSPMKDFGYDVSDYCGIDPMFGTLDDFDEMMETAHGLGLRVMIDLVLSHTSDQHAWFQESSRDKTNPKSDWYVWSDPQPDGTPPNNWLSIFGGSAWQWHPGRCQYFMHNFLTSQPDLNFHNMDVQDALLDVVKFWLDHGVDGFRLDTINFYIHDKKLRSNPPLPPEQRNASIAPAVNPYNHQEHIYSKNQPENIAFLQSLRALLDQYDDRTTVGEVGDAQKGLEIVAEYTSGNDKVHMCYGFDFLATDRPTPERFQEILSNFEQAAQGSWPCWAFSNHDVVRHVTRWELNDAESRLLSTLLVTLKGSVCLYQGEELGLPEAEIAFEDLQDPYGIEFWPEFKGRDGCRTPMVWSNNNSYSGFSMSKPWLPIPQQHMSLAVENQLKDPSAIVHHYRRILKFRRENPALVKGNFSMLTVENGLLAFARIHDGVQILCMFNFSDQAQNFKLGAHKPTALLGHGGAYAESDGVLTVAPNGWYFGAL